MFSSMENVFLQKYSRENAHVLQYEDFKYFFWIFFPDLYFHFIYFSLINFRPIKWFDWNIFDIYMKVWLIILFHGLGQLPHWFQTIVCGFSTERRDRQSMQEASLCCLLLTSEELNRLRASPVQQHIWTAMAAADKATQAIEGACSHHSASVKIQK